jgi:hypothetical protein
MAQKEVYTKSDDDFIIENYYKMSTNEIAKKLGKGFWSVSWRMKQVLKLPSKGNNGPSYTDEEIEVIRRYFVEYGAPKCKELLPNRSIDSIKLKAHKLGLKVDVTKQRLNSGVKRKHKERGWGESNGYVSFLDKDGKVRLYHRWLMEKHLGRTLTDNEVVHHKDENKKNNDILNLEVMTRAEHARHHHKKPK